MILADKTRSLRREMRPQDLLVKSNPGLFGSIHPDITNPRDMYNFLSKGKFPKLADDDLSLTKQNKGFEEKLSRSSSMKDLDKHSTAKIKKKYHFHSHQDLTLIEKKDPSVVALNNNAPYFGREEMDRLPEREKTMMTNFNLPRLNESGYQQGKEDVKKANNLVSLPMIRSAPTDNLAQGNNEDEKVKSKTNKHRTKSNVTFSNKIDKWFSEMPPEVTDKADRAIMEDIIRERMAAYQNDFRLNDKITKLKRRNTNVKSFNQIQHQYLELRAETATRPNRNDVNLYQYRLRQKSSLNLKSEMTDLEKIEKSNSTLPESNTSTNINGALYNDGTTTPIKDMVKSRQQGLNGLKKINLDQLAVDAYKSNPNKRFTFAELQTVRNNRVLTEINEDALRRKADKEHWFRMSTTKTHPSIVNISIEKDMKENRKLSQLQHTVSVARMDAVKESNHVIDQSNFHKTRDIHSTSSTSSSYKKRSSLPFKAALSKFNTLEVFSGTKQVYQESDMFLDSTKHGNPLIKLDLRKSHAKIKSSKDHDNPRTSAMSKQQEMTTVDFRFGSGEVIITRKTNGSRNSIDNQFIQSPHIPPNNTENSDLTPLTYEHDGEIHDKNETELSTTSRLQEESQKDHDEANSVKN